MKRIVAGQRFGSVVTVCIVGRYRDGHVLWLCRCDCGGEKVWQSNSLKLSPNASCGCVAAKIRSLKATKHGKRGTPEYSSWMAAIYRCHNPASKDFFRYGGIGVSVCERWRNSFPNFLSDMGDRPAGTTLDRWPNKSGNYEPGNCRWATPKEQSRNRRSSVYVIWNGEEAHLSDVAANLGISYGAAFNRYKRGTLHAHS